MKRLTIVAVTVGATLAMGCGSAEEAETPETGLAPGAKAFINEGGPPPPPAVRTAEPILASEEGEATFYADLLDRKRTASGEAMDQNAYVAAHRKYPFGTILRVTNTANDRSVRVRVIDRGPFSAPVRSERRIIDLSRRAAEDLGFLAHGFAQVKVDVLRYGQGLAGS